MFKIAIEQQKICTLFINNSS